MLKILTAREWGKLHPTQFSQAESTRRTFSMELSKHRDVERVFAGTINSLDLDLVEKRYLLSGGADGFIAIYDTYNTSGKMKYTCPSVGTIALNNRHRHKFSVETVLWYPLDTGMFTSSGTDKVLKIWDTNRLKPADEYEFSGLVYNHHMSPIATKHCLIAVGYHSSSVVLVDLKSGSATHTLKGHDKSVITVRWSPYHEFLLASGSGDNKIILWDIRNAKSSLLTFDQYNGKIKKKEHAKDVTAHKGNVNGLQFTPDGLHLVSCGTDNRIRLWNTSTGKNTMVNFSGINVAKRRTVQFAVSTGTKPSILYMPNGNRIEMFDTQTGSRIKSLIGHYTQVNSCLFHPDTHELYSAGTDRNILIWTPPTGPTQEEDEAKEKKRKAKREIDTSSVQKTVPQPAATADSWSSDEET